MTLGMLGAGYLAVGAAIAIGAFAARRLGSVTDAVLLIGMWPLWAPLTLGRPGHAGAQAEDPHERELLAVLARAKDSPLASVLPDEANARLLAARLREAGVRLTDLDGVLARPDFDPAAVEQRVSVLAARGATAAAATAGLRVRTIGQLRALRERYRAELDEVHELIAQLVAQAELVRLQPSIAHASGELVRELVSQIEGLDDLFAAQAILEGVTDPVPAVLLGAPLPPAADGTDRPGGTGGTDRPGGTGGTGGPGEFAALVERSR